MTGSNKPLVNITGFEQVSIVVNDIDKTVEALWNTLGLGPWYMATLDADSMSDLTYYGKPARFGFKVALFRQKDGIEIELIEPLEGDSIYRDFLREHGEGVQHLCAHMLDSFETLAETTRTLEKAGFPCITSGRTSIGAFAYIDTTKVLNTVMEIFTRTKDLPPPDRVYPQP